MSSKSKFERLTCKRRESSDDEIYDIATQPVDLNAATSTPVRTVNRSEDEESPGFPCSTQELQDEVDVLWKWNSPQMKQFKSKRPKKRLLMQSSPKVPLRRHPSAEAQSKKDFEKLREELRALREELNRPDNEDILMLSPREEKEIKEEVQLLETSAIDELMLKNLQEPFVSDSEEDVFNDDMEDIMIQCSQQIEEALNRADNRHGDFKHLVLDSVPCGTTSCSRTKSVSSKSAVPSEKLIIPQKKQSLMPSQEMLELNRKFGHHFEKSNKLEPNQQASDLSKSANVDSIVFDDSFDMILSQMGDDGIDQLTQVVDLKQHNHTLSTTVVSSSTNDRMKTVKSALGSLTSHNTLTNTKNVDRTLTNTNKVDSTLTNTKNVPFYVDRAPTNVNNNNNNKGCDSVVLQSRTVQRTASKAVRNDKKSNVFPRFNSAEGLYCGGTKVQTATGKVEFHRTQSFEISDGSLSKNKDRNGVVTNRNQTNQQSEFTDSPIKCSPDEIEKKRLAALAIREAKRQKEMIEKNRQEALKRLEQRRKKNADMVKSSLVKRL